MNMQLQPMTDEPVVDTTGDTRGILAAVEEIAKRDLAPLVQTIDLDGFYPEAVMRSLGEAGAYSQHAPMAAGGDIDLETAIRAMAVVGE